MLHKTLLHMDHAVKKCVFWHMQTAKSDLGLHCPLTESFDTSECMNGEQRPG